MAAVLIRVMIVYVVIIFSMRLMGKRQVGELQTTEFVITILLSEIAAIPIQDKEYPLLEAVCAVLLLSSFEVFSSALSIKSSRFRKVVQGNSLIVIRNGQVDLEQLKKLRISLEDLLEGLRCKDVFDITNVQYAIFETNGEISVMLKPESRTVTAELLNIQPPDNGLPCTVIYDGDILYTEFGECNMTEEKLRQAMNNKGLALSNIMLMIADKSGVISIITRK
ncbi:MAG: DUF421 domain-containing protein [Clostridiales bacterium]|jgi:uncharacterized membrane protein YcaP (DUF421 family)|nr:DUF421 domain-containing protein [Clostridiales bacterium]